ncbi:MAG: restriction endonuclease subunit S [Thermoanaerobaculales bacterium]|nr:restriction endonuclease subunit S [Thermoanaerobaculales bacterium]
MITNIPRGWCWSSVKDLFQNHDAIRVPVKRADRANRSGPYPYYGASGVIDGIDEYLFDGSFLLLGEDGANLLARSKPIAFQAHGKFWVNNHAHVLTPCHGMPIGYFESFFNVTDLSPFITGTAQPKLPQAAMNKIQVPVAPLPEQHRIVAALESYLSRLDDAIASLGRVQRNLKRYRASVLKAAVEGRLVPTEAELARQRRVEAASRRFFERESHDEIKRQDAASTVSFFDPKATVSSKTGNLPHWRQECKTYFLTFRLADSLPKAVSEKIRHEREHWLRTNPKPHSKVQRTEYYRLFSEVLDAKLDAGLGSCVLARPGVRSILRDALYYFDGERYFLHDWVIMPNHVHVLLTIKPGSELSKVVHSIKSFTAKTINVLLDRTGPLWQKEYFDHIVRNVASFERLRTYIAENPRGLNSGEFTVGLEETPWDQDALTRRDAASTFEPASVLLERILVERKKNWIEDAVEKGRAKAEEKAKKAGKPWADDDDAKALDKERAEATKKYKEPEPPDTEGLPDLPEGWCWATVDQLAGFESRSLTDGPFGSNLKTADYTKNGPRVVRLQNIGDGVFVDEEAHISDEHFRTLIKHEVFAGDIVIASLGTEVPRACIIPTWLGPAIVKADCLRFKPNRQAAEAGYLAHALNSNPTRKRTETLVHGVGRPRIGLTVLRSLALPVPPKPEQERIATEAERCLSAADHLLQDVQKQAERIHRLRQSILKWAFEGRLVDRDPNDEPASALLERIKAERALAEKEKKNNRKGRRRNDV